VSKWWLCLLAVLVVEVGTEAGVVCSIVKHQIVWGFIYFFFPFGIPTAEMPTTGAT